MTFFKKKKQTKKTFPEGSDVSQSESIKSCTKSY